MAQKNAINWFEIYSSDFERAKKFYGTILKTPLQGAQSAQSSECQMAMFPFDMGSGVGGSVTQMKAVPQSGTMVYLNVDGDLDGVLSRIPAAGGTILKPKTSIGEHGFIGIFKDSEGNVVGLHSAT